MKIWVYLNGIQQGPYTLEELANMPITASTPVWYEGLPQWLPAHEAPATASLFTGEAENATHETETAVHHEFSPNATASYSPQAAARAEMPPCPPTFMAWSIISMICCCMPGGIVAIIFSALTSGAYSNGDYEKAKKMSERAEWAIIISIVLGLVTAPFSWILWS